MILNHIAERNQHFQGLF